MVSRGQHVIWSFTI